jgi:hypothetical protein
MLKLQVILVYMFDVGSKLMSYNSHFHKVTDVCIKMMNW